MYELYLDEIAARYAGLLQASYSPPAWSELSAQCWTELAADSVRRAAVIREDIDVRETDDPEPWPDARAMCRALVHAYRDGTPWTVSRAFSAHPIWTPDENIAFRIVHDVIGHGRSGGGFDWAGENAACAAHAPLLTHRARRALFTECIAQTGYAIAAGGFGEQRIGLLDDGPQGELPSVTEWKGTT